MRKSYKNEEIFTTQQMYEVGCGDITKCCFDFSKIRSNLYVKFFNGLPQHLYKKVKAVRFCNDNKIETEDNPNAADSQLIDYAQSIEKNKNNYSHYLAKVIWRVLPRAKILDSLTVDSIPLANDEFSEIVDAIKKNTSLRSVTFRNTLIEDDNFVYFLKNVSPYRFETIEFTKCNISSKVINKVCDFLNSQPPASSSGRETNQEWRLREFKLDENEISSEHIEVIDAMMQKKIHPNDTDDQPTITEEGFKLKNGIDRDAQLQENPIEEYDYEYYYEDEGSENGVTKTHKRKRRKIVNNLQINIHHHNKNKPKKEKDPLEFIDEIKKRADKVKVSSPSNNLKILNERLKEELRELLKTVHAIQYSDDVFLIGEDAEKNLEDIRIAEQHVKEYEDKNGEIILYKK